MVSTTPSSPVRPAGPDPGAVETRPPASLGPHEEPSRETLGRLHAYAVALCAREITVRVVGSEWPEFFELARSFVERHGSDEVRDAFAHTVVLTPRFRHTQAAPLRSAERRCFLLFARELRAALVHAVA